MELFKTDMLRFHPPLPERCVYRRRRSRYGCRSAHGSMPAQPLADAVRRALTPVPALSCLSAPSEAGNEAAAA